MNPNLAPVDFKKRNHITSRRKNFQTQNIEPQDKLLTEHHTPEHTEYNNEHW